MFVNAYTAVVVVFHVVPAVIVNTYENRCEVNIDLDSNENEITVNKGGWQQTNFDYGSPLTKYNG